MLKEFIISEDKESSRPVRADYSWQRIIYAPPE